MINLLFGVDMEQNVLIELLESKYNAVEEQDLYCEESAEESFKAQEAFASTLKALKAIDPANYGDL